MAITKIKPLDCSLITRHLSLFLGAVSSVVEHYLDTVGVTGSNPVSRTMLSHKPCFTIQTRRIPRRANVQHLGNSYPGYSRFHFRHSIGRESGRVARSRRGNDRAVF